MIQNFKSCTSRDIGISAGKPQKGVVSKRSAEDESEENKKAKGLPMNQVSESRTRKDRSLSEFSLHLMECRTTTFVSTRI